MIQNPHSFLNHLGKISPVIPFSKECILKDAYATMLQDRLKKTLLDPLQSERSPEEIRKKMETLLPHISSFTPSDVPLSITVICLFKYRIGAFSFLFDLLQGWLLPGKKLDMPYHYCIDYRVEFFGSDVLTFCEFSIRAENEEDFLHLQRNFSIISNDAKLGVSSEVYARKIFEIRGVPVDKKTTVLQQHISRLMTRLPQTFTPDLLTQMQHILVLCHEDFKRQRSISHFVRLIVSHYLFRKHLLKFIQENPKKRECAIKLIQTSVDFPHGRKNILAIAVAMNFLQDKEVFDQRHLLKAVKQFVPEAEVIDQTFFSNRSSSDNLKTMYVEFEKADGKPFSSKEIKLLKDKLSFEIKSNVGTLMLPVFMPRNEEEVMRNMLVLSQQMKYVRDVPQVIISFDEQAERDLLFTVILVRIRNSDQEVKDLIKNANSFLKFKVEKTKNMGMVRKYPKEASVFRVRFDKHNFLRGDHSIDLYQARQAVVNELSRIFGEVRDFNGGMISKQNELLTEVKTLLAADGVQYREITLQNFFYSLAPVIMRTVLEPHAFKSLFKMLLEEQKTAHKKENKCSVKCKFDTNFSYVLFTAPQKKLLEKSTQALSKYPIIGGDLIHGSLHTEQFSKGYIYRCLDLYKHSQFRAFIEEVTKDQNLHITF